MIIWTAPKPLAPSLVEFMDNHIIDMLTGDFVESPSGESGINLSEVVRIIEQGGKGATSLIHGYPVTVGEYAFLAARMENIETWEGTVHQVFMSVCAEDIRPIVNDYSATAWALAWTESGVLTNAGFRLMVGKLVEAGLTFDQCQTFITDKVYNPEIIIHAVEHDIDVRLLQTILHQ